MAQNHACNAKPFGEARTQTAAFGDVRGGMLMQGSIERGDSSSQQGPAMHAKSTAAWSTTRRSLAAFQFKTKGICFGPPSRGLRPVGATHAACNDIDTQRFLVCAKKNFYLSLTFRGTIFNCFFSPLCRALCHSSCFR